MIKVYGTHMTIYLEREKIKFLGLIGLVGKRVVSPPSWYTLVLWVRRLPYHLVVTPLVNLWSYIFLLVLASLLFVVP